MKSTRTASTTALLSVLETQARKATVYLSETLVIKASARHKPRKQARIHEFVVTIGKPNYEEREFIRLCRKAKEPVPVRQVQLKWWPERKR